MPRKRKEWKKPSAKTDQNVLIEKIRESLTENEIEEILWNACNRKIRKHADFVKQWGKHFGEYVEPFIRGADKINDSVWKTKNSKGEDIYYIHIRYNFPNKRCNPNFSQSWVSCDAEQWAELVDDGDLWDAKVVTPPESHIWVEDEVLISRDKVTGHYLYHHRTYEHEDK